MTEHPGGTDGNSGTAPDVEEPMADRRSTADERLATGGLARWMRACATHPWRVVVGWLGIIALLVVLVGTIGGELRDEFEIPGSDTQKATDLIESEFASEQGGVLNLVFAAPVGQRLDTPERKAAIEQAITRLKSSEFKPTRGQGGPGERGRSVQQGHRLRRRPHRLRGSPVRSGHLRQGSRSGSRRRGYGQGDGRSRPA